MLLSKGRIREKNMIILDFLIDSLIRLAHNVDHKRWKMKTEREVSHFLWAENVI